MFLLRWKNRWCHPLLCCVQFFLVNIQKVRRFKSSKAAINWQFWMLHNHHFSGKIIVQINWLLVIQSCIKATYLSNILKAARLVVRLTHEPLPPKQSEYLQENLEGPCSPAETREKMTHLLRRWTSKACGTLHRSCCTSRASLLCLWNGVLEICIFSFLVRQKRQEGVFTDPKRLIMQFPILNKEKSENILGHSFPAPEKSANFALLVRTLHDDQITARRVC